MAYNSIMEEIERQTIFSYQTKTKLTTYSFNTLNLLISIESSKL